ncbi:MAG: SRPBCC family protein, partial [candidate division Zixibacteria bacterium]|nr:SRPBCC family protein [candidate division Zixibacteria bacterium]NIR62527.1 SRPBCC family protein [candidate division Zixibacteria bacterium]NIS44670.1 SRPBCC family protein [candidate division Zixibacteria bacterium]NIU12727.1 SRPBCC family protein [candidate division Zixibacteria bacterium]NIV04835.1 SRPBCC family protein [candidate division Zixibacteria bacterium]
DYRESEIRQTVVAVDLPRELTVLYETRRLRNLHKNLFVEDGSKTLYVSEVEFKFKPLMAVLSFF